MYINMNMNTKRYTIPVHLTLLCLCAAAILGLISGALAVSRQAYPATHMWFNAATVIRNHVFGALGLGALGAVGVCVGWWSVMTPDGRRCTLRRVGLVGADGQTPAHGPFVVCGGAVMAMLAVRCQVVGHVANHILWIALLAALMWCGLFAWARRTAGGSRIPAMLYATLLFSCLLGTFLDTTLEHCVPLALGACALGLGAVAFSPIFGRAATPQSIPRIATGVLVGVAGLIPAGAGMWAAVARPAPPAARPPNILLIGIDTLRLDRTDLVGGADPRRHYTPRLLELARRGTVFENAISQAPWTLPAFSSIMTGKYPHEHGAVSLFGELRAAETTLAEVLREHGYATAAVVSHIYVDAAHGFAQGFDRFDQDCSLGHDAITAAAVTDRAIDTLERQGDRPFFMFVHYFDPHSEFNDHTDWGYADHYDGWLNGPQNDLRNLRNKRHLLEADDIAYLSDLYDEEVAYTDREIGRLLDHLEYAGLERDTVIVVTADHGEELMDRGWIGHTISLFDELIRVPLVVVTPDAPARPTVSATVETRALFPTILEWAAVTPPAGAGPSLMSHLAEAPPHAQSDIGPLNRAFSSVWLPDAELKTGKRVRLLSLRTDRWKLIQDHTRDRTFLFDLSDDPGERVDVSAAHPDRVTALVADLAAWWGGTADRDIAGPSSQPSRADMERLRALGYVE